MTVSSVPIKINSMVTKKEVKPTNTIQSQEKENISLKERQENKYPLSDSDISRMFDELLKVNLIELLEMKHTSVGNKIDYPNYCKYHRLISYQVKTYCPKR